jgi:hypothetical protein
MREDLTRKDITDILADASGNRLDRKDESLTAGVIQDNAGAFRKVAEEVRRQDDVKAAIYLGTINKYIHKKPKSRVLGDSFRLVRGLASLTFPTGGKALKTLGYLVAATVAGAAATAIYFGATMYSEFKILEEKNQRKQKIELKLYDILKKAQEEPKQE